MRTVLLALLTAVFLTSAGCDASGPDPVGAGLVEVVPLEVGTEWTFRHVRSVRFDSSGVVRDTVSVSPSSQPRSIRVARDTVVGGERWAFVEAEPGLAHCVFHGSGWFTHRADGLYALHLQADGSWEADLVYPADGSAGSPFVDTPAVRGVLADPSATYTLPSGPLEARRYVRTWKRLESGYAPAGPIEPTVPTVDHLSVERGPVALETAYMVARAEGRYRPASVQIWERVEG